MPREHEVGREPSVKLTGRSMPGRGPSSTRLATEPRARIVLVAASTSVRWTSSTLASSARRARGPAGGERASRVVLASAIVAPSSWMASRPARGDFEAPTPSEVLLLRTIDRSRGRSPKAYATRHSCRRAGPNRRSSPTDQRRRMGPNGDRSPCARPAGGPSRLLRPHRCQPRALKPPLTLSWWRRGPI